MSGVTNSKSVAKKFLSKTKYLPENCKYNHGHANMHAFVWDAKHRPFSQEKHTEKLKAQHNLIVSFSRIARALLNKSII